MPSDAPPPCPLPPALPAAGFSRRVLAPILLLAVLLYLAGLQGQPLWDSHEPYVGGIIREMTSSGDWVVPTLNGQPYLEKPPLFYAAGAAVCAAFRTHAPWALRLPSSLFAMAAMVGAGFVAFRLGSARAAIWAAVMVGTSYLFFNIGHLAVVDMAVTSMVSLSFGFACLAMAEPEARRRWVGAFWATLGLAFLAKGVFAFAIVLLPLAAALALQRDGALVRAFLRPNLGMALALFLGLAWIIPLLLRGGTEFFTEVFLRNTLGRFLASPALVPRTGRLGEHANPFYFYFLNSPGSVVPWTGLWIAALVSGLGRERRERDPARGLAPLLFGASLALLSLSVAKRTVYLLPVLPITLVHTALWLDRILPRKGVPSPLPPRHRALLALTLGAIGLLGCASPWYYLGGRAGHPALAAGISLGSCLLTAFTLQGARTQGPEGAFRRGLVHWALFMFVFSRWIFPLADRGPSLLEPYRAARTLEQRGAHLFAGGLNETCLGYSSLELRHPLPVLSDPRAIAARLEHPASVACLVDGRLWTERLQGRVRAVEQPSEALRNPSTAARVPRLVLNEAALALQWPQAAPLSREPLRRARLRIPPALRRESPAGGPRSF